MAVENNPVAVLVAEGDGSRSPSMATVLDRTDGFSVEVVSSGAKALAVVVETEFDCVVSTDRLSSETEVAEDDSPHDGTDLGDCDSPSDGIELLRSIRASNPELPFVLAPAEGSEAVAAAAVSAGVTEYVPSGDATDGNDSFAERLVGAVARTADVSGQSRRETVTGDESLGREGRFLEQTLDAVDDVFYLVDPDGSLRRWNDRLSEVTGYTDAEIAEMNALEFFPPEDRERIAAALDRSLESGTETVEARYQTKDGELLPYEFSGSVLTDDDGDVVGIAGIGRDIGDRRERIAELRRKTRALDEANVGVTITDPSQPDNPIVYANERFTELTGYDTEEVIGRNCRFLQGSATDPETVAEVRAAVEAEEPISVELWNERADRTRFWNQLKIAPVRDETGEVTNFLGFQYDATDRKEYQLALSALHDVTRSLLEARDADTVAREVTEAASRVLDVEAAGVFLYDETENVLRPAASATARSDLIAEIPTVEAGESSLWEAFASGEIQSGSESGLDSALASSIPSAVMAPLGDHGVLFCGWTTATKPDGQTVELVETLAATATTVFDRIERDEQLRGPDSRLLEEQKRLSRQVALADTIRRTTNQLLAADTRKVAHDILCRNLSAVEWIDFVWSGEGDDRQNTIHPVATGGRDGGYLSAVDLGVGSAGEESRSSVPPSVRAYAGTQSVVIDNVADSLRDGDWQPAALSRDYRTVLAVPIADGTRTYGVVSLYADRLDVFDDQTRRAMTALGETVAHALSGIERRQVLAGGGQVEIEFDVSAATTPTLALAETLDGELTVENVLPDDPSQLFGTVPEAATDEFRSACETTDGIERGEVLVETDDSLSVRLEVSDSTLVDSAVEFGGSFRRLSAADDEATLTVAFGSASAVGDSVRRFTDHRPNVRVRARRETQHVEEAQSPLASLTDRQVEVLVTAHHSGYFDWPRRASSDTVAETLGVSDATFLEHLRRAEQKLLDTVLTDGLDTA